MEQRSRKWFGTLNNPEEPEQMDAYLRKLFDTGNVVYVCGQMERGENGTPHLQYAVWFKQPRRLVAMKKICARTHWEAVKSDKGFDYCMKEDTRIEGPWEYGTKPVKRNSKTDWDEVLTKAKEGKFEDIPADILVKNYRTLQAISKDHMQLPPDLEGCRGVWIYGEPGTGKTQFIKDSHQHGEIYYKIANKWWDGFRPDEHKFVLLDDLDPDRANMLVDRLKIWLDKNAFIAEIKCGAIPCCPELFYVTSNYTIEECFKNPRDAEAIKQRCKVIHHEAPLVPYVRKLQYDLREEKAVAVNDEEAPANEESQYEQILT